MARFYVKYYFSVIFIYFGTFYVESQVKPERVVIEEGQELLWPCDIQKERPSDDRPFSWKRNNQWVNRSWVLADGSLHIPVLSRGLHEGVYNCCQSYSYLSGIERELLVSRTCLAVATPRETVLRVGDTHTWQCEVVCSNGDDATVGWRKDGRPIKGQGLLQDGSLQVLGVASGDGGIYRCCASNSIGTFCSKGAKLIVVSDLPLLTIQPQSQVTVGSTARLQCLPPSGPLQLNANYRWLFNGASFIRDNALDGQRVTILPQGIIQFTRVLRSDAGLYQCSIDTGSSVGHLGNTTLQVTGTSTQDTPQWLIFAGPISQDRRIGSSALLECLPQEKSLVVEWTRQDGQPLSSLGIQWLGGSNLYFERLSAADSGDYTCNVTDPVTGKYEHASATLRVLAPPVIRFPLPATQKVKRGHLFKLNCSDEGNTTWLLDGAPIQPDRTHVILPHVLRVLYSSSTDAGVYQCVVDNGGGGESVSSTEIRFVDGAPDPPSSAAIVGGTSTSFTVSWRKPRSVTAWMVRYHALPDGAEETELVVGNSEMIKDRVTPFTEYIVFAVAFNSVSGSDPFEMRHLTDPAVPVAGPVFFLSSIGERGVRVSCLSMLRENRRGLVTGYPVEYHLEGSHQTYPQLIPATGSGDVIMDLQQGSTYQFKVAAANVAGVGPFSPWQEVRVGNTEGLTRPLAHVEVSNGTSVSVVWSPAPANSTADGYRYILTNADDEAIGDVRTIPSSKSMAVITNLEPDTDYEIHVAAHNQYGDGPRSVLNFTTPSVEDLYKSPACPILPPFRISSLDVTSTGLLLSWSEPITGLAYDKFVIQYAPLPVLQNQAKELVIEDPSVFYRPIRGLQPYTSYSFRVRVGCLGGLGRFSYAYVVLTLQDVPATPPESIHAQAVDQHTVDVEWQPPLKPNGVIVHYMVLYNKDNVTPEDYWMRRQSNGTSQKSIIENLDSGTRYFFKVKAATFIGDGPSTDPVPASTKSEMKVLMSQKQLGILIGVSLALLCIILCCILIIFKYRSVDPRATRPPYHHHSRGRAHTCPYMEVQREDGTGTPMLVTDPDIRTTFHTSGHYVAHCHGSGPSPCQEHSHNPHPHSTSSVCNSSPPGDWQVPRAPHERPPPHASGGGEFSPGGRTLPMSASVYSPMLALPLSTDGGGGYRYYVGSKETEV